MKRLLVCFLLASVAVCAVLSGCTSGEVYTGEYAYTQYGTNYGVRVRVAVEEGKIKAVKIASSDYVSVSEPMGEWTEENANKWKEGLDGILKEYEGMTVEEVLALKVAVSEDGAPLVKGDEGFVNYDGGLIISGSTLGSGRLLLAVQDALSALS